MSGVLCASPCQEDTDASPRLPASDWRPFLGAGVASAKTLVYCSEGSPENFTPPINTTGTSFDAARPVYNQLVEFERGTTKVIPGLAESWEVVG